jgi:hypothetical protein
MWYYVLWGLFNIFFQETQEKRAQEMSIVLETINNTVFDAQILTVFK